MYHNYYDMPGNGSGGGRDLGRVRVPACVSGHRRVATAPRRARREPPGPALVVELLYMATSFLIFIHFFIWQALCLISSYGNLFCLTSLHCNPVCLIVM